MLDVAGGKGELAFQLRNLNAIPTAVVDPRPLQLGSFQSRLARGMYHRNPVLSTHNTVAGPDPARPNGVAPEHCRIFFDAEMHRLVLGDGNFVGDGDAPCIPVHATPKRWDDHFRSSTIRSLRTKWTLKGLRHEDDTALGGGGDRRGDGGDDGRSGGGTDAPPPRSPVRCDGVDAGRSAPTGPGPLECPPASSSTPLAPAPGDAQAYQSSPRRGKACVDCPARAQELLTTCSAIVGLHPDQAAGAIIDFSLALRVPFAIVPCCVYSAEFTKRKVDGEQVKSYDDLLRFLQAKHPAIRAQDLDFEGKNRCLWWAPELRHELPAPDSNPTSVKSDSNKI